MGRAEKSAPRYSRSPTPSASEETVARRSHRRYQFRLDNGGNDEGFGPLTITLQLKDKYGQTLVTRKMETEAFGDSNATRTTDAFLETECVENVATTEIIKATEESNGHRVSLPLSVFNPQDYHPLLITVSGKNVN